MVNKKTYRLTPVYAAILGFIATLLVYCGNGPQWQYVHSVSQLCRYHWWSNLLYINNYAQKLTAGTAVPSLHIYLFILNASYILQRNEI